MGVNGWWYSFNKKATKAVCDQNDSAALSLGVELLSSAEYLALINELNTFVVRRSRVKAPCKLEA